MKKALLFACAFLFLAVMVQAQTPVNPQPSAPVELNPIAQPQQDIGGDPNAPAFKWEEEIHDFGTIPQGNPATVKFWFTNVGKAPLKIENAKPTCGCTTPNWSREDIAPGQKGFIEATYNAAAPGQFNKGITVTSNAATPTLMLHLKGEVLKKEEIDFHDNNMLNNNPMQTPGGH